MWPGYVINLSPNVLRMENSARQLDAAGLSWERIDAVYGRDLSAELISEVYDSKRNALYGKQPMVASEIGCYLSHILAWEKISSGSYIGGFVFEDDFATDGSLAEKCALLSEQQDDWDMVKLFSFDQDPKLEWKRPLGPYRIGIPYKVPTCLIGYGIKKEAAKHLVECSRPFFRPVDEDIKFVWETGLRVAVILPSPIRVGDQSTVTGTVGDERRASVSGKRDFVRGLRNLRYSLLYSLQLARHRHRERRSK